ncbi:hypothetical protein [Pendulispora albinea]|uniref:Uncharacterized protein n=1 Tax=Pendulispora albinea TaxID=2741071 RepID=A0ABZ2LY54_9BACT
MAGFIFGQKNAAWQEYGGKKPPHDNPSFGALSPTSMVKIEVPSLS